VKDLARVWKIGMALPARGACCAELVDPGAPQALDHGVKWFLRLNLEIET
jgi:hypothetical protein